MPTRPLHVVISAHQSGPRRTGLARYIDRLVEHLAPLTGPEFVLTILLGRDRPDHPVRRGAGPAVRVVDVPWSGGLDWRPHLQARRLAGSLRCDVYHHPHLDLPPLGRVPAVATIHDLKYVLHPEFFPRRSRLKRFVLDGLLRATTRRARALIAVSGHTARDLAARYGVPEERITVVHHGIDGNLPAPTPPVSDPTPYILFVGERRPHKNLPRLIQALARVAEEIPHRLVVAGPAYAGYDAPERAVRTHGLEDRVRFEGSVDDGRLAALYAGAAFLVLPSLYEGFGFPVLEAMAFGVPVIASNTSSLPEVAGEAALLVEPDSVPALAEALRTLACDPPLRHLLAEAGKARAAAFTWNRCAHATLEVYARAAR